MGRHYRQLFGIGVIALACITYFLFIIFFFFLVTLLLEFCQPHCFFLKFIFLSVFLKFLLINDAPPRRGLISHSCLWGGGFSAMP